MPVTGTVIRLHYSPLTEYSAFSKPNRLENGSRRKMAGRCNSGILRLVRMSYEISDI